MIRAPESPNSPVSNDTYICAMYCDVLANHRPVSCSDLQGDPIRVAGNRPSKVDYSMHTLALALLSAAAFCAPNAAAQDAEIEEIKQAIAELKTDYEKRIDDLEHRLMLAEKAVAAAQQDPVARTTSATQQGSITSGNAFNPQISVILDGNFYHDSIDGLGPSTLSEAAQPSQPGHDEHEHEEGAADGMNFRSVELAFSGTVDPYFDAAVFIALEQGGEIDIEEAWFATRALPAGLKLKAGKFLSEFGYLNDKHEHQWDFVDQNLAYLDLLGDHGLQDTGVQMTWLPKMPFYALLGAEILQGDQERVGSLVADETERAELGLADPEGGPRTWTLFAKVSPDLGYNHALQIGGSFVHNRQHQEIYIEDMTEFGLEGPADLWGLDVVYKYDNAAAYGYRDFNLQAEYLRSGKDLTVRGGDPGAIGDLRKFTTDGLYVQGSYGFAQRWRAGLRYDVLGLTNKVDGGANDYFTSSDRWTTALTWTPTEFSRFRLQYARSDILLQTGEREDFDAFWLQFLMSLGAHGAHDF